MCKEHIPAATGRSCSLHAAIPFFEAFLLLFCLLGSIGCVCSGQRYDRGRDSHMSFGDGEYQLLGYYINNTRHYDLYNEKFGQAVLYDVQDYQDISGILLFTGSVPLWPDTGKLYIALDVKTNCFYILYDRIELSAKTVEKINSVFGREIKSRVIAIIPMEDSSESLIDILETYRNQG